MTTPPLEQEVESILASSSAESRETVWYALHGFCANPRRIVLRCSRTPSCLTAGAHMVAAYRIIIGSTTVTYITRITSGWKSQQDVANTRVAKYSLAWRGLLVKNGYSLSAHIRDVLVEGQLVVDDNSQQHYFSEDANVDPTHCKTSGVVLKFARHYHSIGFIRRKPALILDTPLPNMIEGGIGSSLNLLDCVTDDHQHYVVSLPYTFSRGSSWRFHRLEPPIDP
ncbi:unnamed protein product [Euphydryas editha]|uniref:Uncharacterized protein n=1 Tax=Euphydryas editha TaxID=104508 RepID=A0AAU9U0F9_EUPED|nr:unnamed protein product [Euphydryas editha]